jgi:hypothetical protein
MVLTKEFHGCRMVQPGWGYSSRIAEMCVKGTWNAGGNRSPCEQCEYGKTTASTGANSSSMCISEPGFGGNQTDCPPGDEFFVLQILK